MPAVAPNNIRTTLGAALTTTATQIQLAPGFGATLKAALLSGANYDGLNALGTGQIMFLSVGGPAGEIIKITGPWNNATADLIGGAAGGTFTRQYDGTTHGGSTWAINTVAEVLDPRALFELFAQPDRAQTWSVLQTINDGMAKLLGAIRKAVLGGTTAAAGKPAAATLTGEAQFFAHGFAGSVNNPRLAHLAFNGDTAMYQPSHDDCSIAKCWPSGTSMSGENFGIARHGTMTTIAPVNPAVDKRGVHSYTRCTPTSNAGAGFSTDSVGNNWSVTRHVTQGEGRWTTTHMFAIPHASLPSSTTRMAVGVSSLGIGSGGSTGLVTADPSGQTQHCLMIACDAADTNITIMSGDGVAGHVDKTALNTPRAKAAMDGLYVARFACEGGDGVNRGALSVELIEFANGSFVGTVLHRGAFTPANGYLPGTAPMYPVCLKGNDGVAPFDIRGFHGVMR